MAKRLLFAAAVLFVATLVVHAAADEPGEPSPLCDGEPCDAVKRGLASFLDGQLEGLGANGRSCADCHMPTDNFQLSPENVEARFRRLQARRHGDTDADDPLFRPVDADDFRVNGDAASDFGTLRRLGLIRIPFTLPPQLKLLRADGSVSTETTVDVWRMVPSVNDVAITGPDFQNRWSFPPVDPVLPIIHRTGGYQLDARFGSLQEQALAALQTHAEIGVPVMPQMLEDLASFQRTLFTNNQVRKLAEAMRLGVDPLPDPDQGLSPLETEGKAVFVRACAQCHGGPAQTLSQTTSPSVVRYHAITTQCPRPVDAVSPPRFVFKACPPDIANKARAYRITLPSGLTTERVSSDPGRALMTGFVAGVNPSPFDDWNKFDMPGLRGISKTAPYFHNNTADTLEDVVEHYIAFFTQVIVTPRPPTVPLPAILTTDGVNTDRPVKPAERAALLAYLRKL
jgi:cytochrome c peroxidase